MMHSPENWTAGFPAARTNYLRPVSEQDREIVRRINRGDDRHDISHELHISLAVIKGAEERVERECEAEALLAADPESLEGLYLSGVFPSRAYYAARWHSRDWEGPEIKRLSDVAACGRSHWLCTRDISTLGQKSLEQIDWLLKRAGIEWASDDCAPKRKEREPVVSPPSRPHAELLTLIGRLKVEVEMQREQIAALRGDIAPRHSAGRDGLETAGNVVCLPGVTLASIQLDGGDDPGPSAA
jgi:hypothetical protein